MKKINTANTSIFILAIVLLTLSPSCRKSPASSYSGSYGTGKVEASSEAKKVIATARSYRGTKYKYGGTSKRGMDCSGLICTSFSSINVSLPRTSSDQSSSGKKIRIKDLQPGDLVFFSPRKGSRKITHVGLVTEIRGSDEIMFIHASTKSGVVESNLFSPWYQKVFVKAVRVL